MTSRAVSAAKTSAIRASCVPSAPVIERCPVARLQAASAREQRRAVDRTGQVGQAVLDRLEGTDRDPELLALLDPAGRQVERCGGQRRPARRRPGSAIRGRRPRTHRGRSGRSPARSGRRSADRGRQSAGCPDSAATCSAGLDRTATSSSPSQPMTRSATAPAGRPAPCPPLPAAPASRSARPLRRRPGRDGPAPPGQQADGDRVLVERHRREDGAELLRDGHQREQIGTAAAELPPPRRGPAGRWRTARPKASDRGRAARRRAPGRRGGADGPTGRRRRLARRHERPAPSRRAKGPLSSLVATARNGAGRLRPSWASRCSSETSCGANGMPSRVRCGRRSCSGSPGSQIRSTPGARSPSRISRIRVSHAPRNSCRRHETRRVDRDQDEALGDPDVSMQGRRGALGGAEGAAREHSRQQLDKQRQTEALVTAEPLQVAYGSGGRVGGRDGPDHRPPTPAESSCRRASWPAAPCCRRPPSSRCRRRWSARTPVGIAYESGFVENSAVTPPNGGTKVGPFCTQRQM